MAGLAAAAAAGQGRIRSQSEEGAGGRPAGTPGAVGWTGRGAGDQQQAVGQQLATSQGPLGHEKLRLFPSLCKEGLFTVDFHH